jgi:hypothetical protein
LSRSWLSRCGVALSLLTSAAMPRFALAQSEQEPAGCNAEDPTALDHYEEGRRHFEAAEAARGARREREFRLALHELEQSYASCPRPDVLHALGSTHTELGERRKALDAFNLFLSVSRDLSPDERAQLELVVLDHARELGVGLVDVAADAAAVVSIDGAAAGEAPLRTPLVLPAGEHAIVATRPGFVPAQQALTVVDGQRLSIALTLTIEPPPDHVPPSEAQQESPPPAPRSPPPHRARWLIPSPRRPWHRVRKLAGFPWSGTWSPGWD